MPRPYSPLMCAWSLLLPLSGEFQSLSPLGTWLWHQGRPGDVAGFSSLFFGIRQGCKRSHDIARISLLILQPGGALSAARPTSQGCGKPLQTQVRSRGCLAAMRAHCLVEWILGISKFPSPLYTVQDRSMLEKIPSAHSSFGGELSYRESIFSSSPPIQLNVWRRKEQHTVVEIETANRRQLFSPSIYKSQERTSNCPSTLARQILDCRSSPE